MLERKQTPSGYNRRRLNALNRTEPNRVYQDYDLPRALLILERVYQHSTITASSLSPSCINLPVTFLKFVSPCFNRIN